MKSADVKNSLNQALNQPIMNVIMNH